MFALIGFLGWYFAGWELSTFVIFVAIESVVTCDNIKD